jgi:DNA-binding IclR family transcriptional regulator
MDLPKTTVSSIVSTLESLGYLEKEPSTGKYRLGSAIFNLGVQYASNMDLVAQGRAWVERLCFQFMEPVNAGMFVGDKIVLIMRKEPDDRYMIFPQAGSIIPFHSTCIGKILLAYMDSGKRDRLLSNYTFDQFTPNTITSKELFLKELEKVKAEGIGFENQESIRGLVGIGGPVFNHTGAVIAAFAISGNPDTIEPRRDEIISAVRFTSEQISAQLNFKK